MASGPPLPPTTPQDRAVYIVDDEVRVRLAVTTMLEGLGYDVWSFPSGADLLDALGEIAPGCLLVDIQMPAMPGLELMARLAARGCAWPVIIMTAHADVPIAVQAMKRGALEFIEKPFDATALQDALDLGFAAWAREGERRSAQAAAAERLNRLTPRERSVLAELVKGRQNKIVAHTLGLSTRTVEMHRANLLGKLGLRTAQEAVALVACAGNGVPLPAPALHA